VSRHPWGVTRIKRLYEDPPGLVPAAYLPGGDLAAALAAAGGWAAKVKVCGSFAARLRLAPLSVLCVVGIGLVLDHLVSPQARDQIVLANSTNVHNLEHHQIWTLVTSALLPDEPVHLAAMVRLLLLMSVAELLWGWRRLLEVFFLGNAVASCLVYALLRAGVHEKLFNGAVTLARDVGTSYGAHAVSGAIVFCLPVRARRLFVPLALLAVVVPLIGQRTFTDLGHLLSTLIGFVTGWQMRRRPLAGRVRRPAVLRTDRPLAYCFDTVAAARDALTAALHVQEQHRIHLHDATIAWSDQSMRVHVRETRDMDGLDGAIAGGCWGVVAGTLLGLPLAGLVVGAVLTAIAARLHDSGLRDTAVEQAVQAAPPGTAVLLLLADPADQPLLTATLSGTAGAPLAEPRNLLSSANEIS
jgi:uncharacterized membrane protein/membrane associated rhomboid family serine protease